jgi:hypothetical protein
MTRRGDKDNPGTVRCIFLYYEEWLENYNSIFPINSIDLLILRDGQVKSKMT